MGGWVDRWTVGWMGMWMDGWMDGLMAEKEAGTWPLASTWASPPFQNFHLTLLIALAIYEV